MYELTSRTTEENKSTTAESRCVRLTFTEIAAPSPAVPSPTLVYLGSITISATIEEAAQYAFGVEYPDPVIAAS